MELGLHRRSVLVTGGSRGIGREIALAFAREGANVAVCARDHRRLDAVVSELRLTGIQAEAIVADLSDGSACLAAVEGAARAFGGIDVLINNASTDLQGYPMKLADASDDQLFERVNGKALAAIRCSRAALQFLRRSDQGRIIFVGGDAARSTFRSHGLYSAGSGTSVYAGLGNAVVVNFAKHLANEVAKDGILVNVVHPGAVKSDRYPGRIARLAMQTGTTVDVAEKAHIATVPIGRVVETSDIAPLVVFLASSQAAAITGQTIAVDGGANPQIVY